MSVGPERLGRWVEGFVERHGACTTALGDAAAPGTVVLVAADGSEAHIEVPFPPLATLGAPVLEALLAHVLRPRTVGVLLVRLGGYAAGVFDGGVLVSSKVGSRQVHGRSAAGGWSQQRFARRREGQASVALQSAADNAVRILVGRPMDAVVVGGERTAVEAVLDDRRLAEVKALVTGRLLDVPDPRLTVLQKAPYRDVWIRVVETGGLPPLPVKDSPYE